MKEPLENSAIADGCHGEKTAGLKIAVFGSETEIPSNAINADRIFVFGKRKGHWTEERSHKIPEMDYGSPTEARNVSERIALLIDDCAVVAAKSISGIIYSVFDRCGKHIFEIPEISGEQFIGIAEEVALNEAKRAHDVDAFKKAAPQETESPGVFFLDLIKIFEQFPELSSKMIIKPFLKNTPFRELVIACHHCPVWLDDDATYHITKKLEGNVMTVTVTGGVIS